MKTRITTIAVIRQQKKILMLSAAVFALAVMLSGCRAEEQGRVLQYEAGTYKGKTDTKLGSNQIRVLQDRTALQTGVSAQSGGSPTRNPDVIRPKASETIDWKALDSRFDGQKSEPVKMNKAK